MVLLRDAGAWELLNLPVDVAIDLFDSLRLFIHNSGTECSWNVVFFHEIFVLQFCCSAGVLPAWCVYTHWHQEKTEKDQSPECSDIFGKNTIFNEHPVVQIPSQSHSFQFSVPSPHLCSKGTYSVVFRCNSTTIHRGLILMTLIFRCMEHLYNRTHQSHRHTYSMVEYY